MMFAAHTAHILLVLIAALSIVLMLLRPRGIAEAWWISSGAMALVVLRLIPLSLAGRAVMKGLDVYLFLTGMMILAELARLHGVFDWLAAMAIRNAKGSCARLFTLIYAVGTVVTIFMSNDATAVVLTPAVLTAVKKARTEPLPYLFACALIANAASFVLPISNPANLVVFHTGMPPLARWLASFALPSALSITTTYAVLRWLFRRPLRECVEQTGERSPLTGTGKLTFFGILAVAGVLLAASAMNMDLGLPTFVAGSAIAALVCLKARGGVGRILREISWSVLPLVAGLFVLVEAVNSIGALHFTADALRTAAAWPRAAGLLAAGFGVGVGNNLINNLPLGLIAGTTLRSTGVHGLLANAVLVGVDLGPNLSVTGSLATILWLIALRREGIDVSAGRFLKIGALAMPAALLLALAGLLAHANWQ